MTSENQIKLKPEVKAAWVAALTSGEYQQTRGVLQQAEYSEALGYPVGFCCLGVLCDLYKKISNDPLDFLDWKVDRSATGAAKFGGEKYGPPQEVYQWAFGDDAIPISNGRLIAVRDKTGKLESLDKRNDDGATFEEIAALINENL